jgi:hypothetical protein
MTLATACSGTDLFEGMLGDIKYPKDSKSGKLFPFTVRCGLVRKRPPRHEFFEFIIDMGRGNIERIMTHEPLTQSDPIDLTFVFPERWMAVCEQVEFMSKLTKHPDVEKIRSIDILTSSPMIIGNFMAAQVRILTWPDDEETAEPWAGFA